MSGLDHDNAIIQVNGQRVESRYQNNTASADIELEGTGTVTLQVTVDGTSLEQLAIPVIPGWVSVLPPLVAILLSFALRSVIPSLFFGLIVELPPGRRSISQPEVLINFFPEGFL